jgi:hypothetical protein
LGMLILVNKAFTKTIKIFHIPLDFIVVRKFNFNIIQLRRPQGNQDRELD